MASIKEEMKRHFGVNESSLEPLPSREIALEEMLRHRAESKKKLKEKGNRRSGTRKESIGDLSLPCPKCGTINWDQFPDGRKYCLNCGAVMETDGTVTGGAIKRETPKQIDEIDKNMVIICEFTCSECSEVIQAQGKDIELAKKKVIPHKAYDYKSRCSGTFTFSRQVFPNHENTPISETIERTGAFMNALGTGKDPRDKNPNINFIMDREIEKRERFDHPKREKFVCYRCDWSNCSETYNDAIICLLINIDMKLKKLLERLPQ